MQDINSNSKISQIYQQSLLTMKCKLSNYNTPAVTSFFRIRDVTEINSNFKSLEVRLMDENIFRSLLIYSNYSEFETRKHLTTYVTVLQLDSVRTMENINQHRKFIMSFQDALI